MAFISKFKAGDEVEAQFNSLAGYKPATVESVEQRTIYTIRFTDPPYRGTSERTESQIRLPRPSPEEAWEKATALIGKRSGVWHGDMGFEAFNKETRHQCYQILGAAGVKVTDEVRRDMRRLIDMADSL